ncbi:MULTISPECIES: Cof-type HAD-IIB family hydrolase [unclassified Paenibacillus]|uniref:Cof-type HAD-IIB family hydrolase n=1 Tax=unclassified Paenibacillus TaxID=185978 RepID=UPI002F4052BC
MSYKVVFFDIDGTLVNEEKVIPADTIEAIKQLKESGVEPVIATGRAPYFIQPLLEQLNIESYVCLNGSYVVYKGVPIFKRAISKDVLAKFVSTAEQNKHSLVFEGEHTFSTNGIDDPFVTAAIKSLKVDMPDYNPNFWQEQDVMQIFLHCVSADEHLYDHLREDFTLIRWHDQAMDVLPNGISKAVGVIAMLDKLGISTAEAAAFGDGLNDKEMLDTVGFGVAMGNAHPDLLPFADYITSHVDEKGIRNGLVKAGLLIA